MKRSATLSTIAAVAGLTLATACSRDAATAPTNPQPTADSAAPAETATATATETATDRAGAPPADAGDRASATQDPAELATVIMPTAPANAVTPADHVETAGIGFAGRREPWRERVNGVSRPLPRKLDDDLIDRCIEVARDIDPKLGGRLALLREKNPAQLEATLRKTERLYALALLKQRDPSLYQLKLVELNVDREISRLTGEYREAVHAGRDPVRIEQQLRMQLRLQLAFQFRNREEHLCDLRELIEQLEIEFEAEKAYLEEHFDDVVEERIREIAGGIEPPPPE